MALAVVSIASMGSISSTLSGMGLQRSNRDTADATAVMQQLLEELQAVPFEELHARFNADPDDDPDGDDTARGDSFTIVRDRKSHFLDASAIVKAGFAAYRNTAMDVQISFPVDGAGVLSEAGLDGSWGSFNADMNGDGETDGDDRREDYRLLPMRVRVSWVGKQGATREFVVTRLFSRRMKKDD